VAAPRVALAAAWSLVLLAAALVGGRLLDRRRLARAGGSLLALGCFAANVALATPLSPGEFPLLALQASTVVAAGFLGVVTYRLLARAHDRHTGVVAGLATVVASPLLVWATIPKRHVLVSLLVVCTAYLLYRSRTAGSTASYRRSRAAAYVPVALAAWVHAAEGLVLLVALLAVDPLTARRNDPRTLATVAAAFGLALVPFLATNAAISGDPLAPPRALRDFPADGPAPAAILGAPVLAAAAVHEGWAATAGAFLVGGLAEAAPQQLIRFLDMLSAGVRTVTSEPSRLVRTFVRSGYPDRVAGQGRAIAVDVAVLESLPVAAGLLAAPLARRRGRGDGGESRSPRWTPGRTVDAFLGGVALMFALVYVARLPLHVQFTARYLLPLFPIAVYGLARLPWVREAVRERGDWLTWTYAAGVLVGGQLVFAGLRLVDAAVGEAIQAYALLGLATAVLVAGWSLASGLGRGDDRVGAVVLGLAGATTTSFMLAVGLYYFARGADHLLPVVPGL
jgi:hypothetical protein